MNKTGPDDARLLALVRSAFGTIHPEVIGVAVSGGSDSVALLHLAARFQAERGGLVRAVTVDHRLRPEAADEARFVAGLCETLGVRHDTVEWPHGPLAGNIPDQARRARYDLVTGWAQCHGITHVVVGHTADDDAETFLMELARQAGIDGLASMRRFWHSNGIYWARPLLSVSRESLRQYLRGQNVGWIEDPTNEDETYLRVKARRALAALVPLGITGEGLARVAANLRVAQAELVSLAARAAEEFVTERAGELVMDRLRWRGLGPDTGRRLVIAAVRWVGSAPYAPRGAEVARLEEAIHESHDATLGGCHLRCSPEEIRFTREPRAVAGVETSTDALWDKRWRLSGPHDKELVVRALGGEGLRLCPDWRATGHSRAALIVAPAIWRGEDLVAAPVAGMTNGWTAEIVTPFHSFLFPH